MNQPARANRGPRVGNRPALRATLIAAGFLATAVLIGAPLAVIFMRAFSGGVGNYLHDIAAPDTLHAIGLTVLTAVIVVPLNLLFGFAAAWSITRFAYPGRQWLITLIELPFSISPIVAGTIYLFVYGRQGVLGPWLGRIDVQIMFSLPAIILVTLFVTSPYIARELITFMRAQGSEDEEAARTLGANGLQLLWRITLPNVRLALLCGVVLCTARAVGEFGAVSVVSGNIRGQTNTLPLQIELLYNDYNSPAAFAAASVLTLIAIVTIAAKAWLERRYHEAGR
jgi:sulfate transport system permease protein